MLTDRLRSLVGAGVLKKAPYREAGKRGRDEYRLTDKWLDLYPAFMALQAWGDRHLPGPDGPPFTFVHRECGADAHLAITCDTGHEVPISRDIAARLGPGARRRPTPER